MSTKVQDLQTNYYGEILSPGGEHDRDIAKPGHQVETPAYAQLAHRDPDSPASYWGLDNSLNDSPDISPLAMTEVAKRTLKKEEGKSQPKEEELGVSASNECPTTRSTPSWRFTFPPARIPDADVRKRFATMQGERAYEWDMWAPFSKDKQREIEELESRTVPPLDEFDHGRLQSLKRARALYDAEKLYLYD